MARGGASGQPSRLQFSYTSFVSTTARVLTSLAIVEDVTTPAVVSGSGTGATTTASFSPPAGSLLVALVAGGFGTTGNTVATVTDSLGGTWSTGVTATGTNATTRGVAGVFYRYLSSAPGAMTVSVAFTNLTGGRFLAVRVLNNAATSQSAAASGTAINSTNTTSGTVSITTTTVGSLVYGISDDAGLNDAWAPNGATVAAAGAGTNYSDAPDGCELVAWQAINATITPGATTLGGTWAGATKSNIAAFEILPFAAGFTTADTAPASGAGAAGTPTAPGAAVTATATTASGIALASDAIITTATGVAYVNSTNATSAGTTSLVVTVPTGGSVGDIILFCVSNRWPDVWSIPAGLSLGLASRNGPTLGTLYYRIVQAGDPSTYTFTQANSAVCSAVCSRYSRPDPINPIRFWSSGQSDDAVAATSITFPTLQNVSNLDMIVAFVTASSNVANTTTPVPSTPATWSGRQSVIANAAALASVATAVFDKTAATDTPSSTGYSGFYLAYNVCLAAAAAATPVVRRMAPTFRTASTASTSTSTTSLAISAPSGVTDGDLLIATTGASNNNTVTLTGTWTPLCQDTPGYDGGSAVDIRPKTWLRIASSEPGSYTVGVGASSPLSAAILRYSNVDGSNPIRMLSIVSTTTAAATTSPVPTAVLTQQPNDLVLNCYVFGTGTSVAPPTLTPPGAGWTTRASIVTTIATDFQCGIAMTEKINATDFPTASVTVASGWSSFSIALAGIVGAPQAMKMLSQAMNRASTY